MGKSNDNVGCDIAAVCTICPHEAWHVKQLTLYHMGSDFVRREVAVVANDAAPVRRQALGDVATGEALPAGDHDCVHNHPRESRRERAARVMQYVGGGPLPTRGLLPTGGRSRRPIYHLADGRMTSIAW
jgi:hypothetical protein